MTLSLLVEAKEEEGEYLSFDVPEYVLWCVCARMCMCVYVLVTVSPTTNHTPVR